MKKKKTRTTTETTVQTSLRIPKTMLAQIDEVAASGLVKAQRTDVILALIGAGLAAIGRANR